MSRSTMLQIPLLLSLWLLAGLASPGGAQSLEMLVWSWEPDTPAPLDVDAPLERALEEVTAGRWPGTALTRVPRRLYEDEVALRVGFRDLPELLWVTPELIPWLVRQDLLVPLDELVAERPYLLEGLPRETVESYRHQGLLYGVPLGFAGDLPYCAYAVTVGAAERGLECEAQELLALLRERVPRWWLPDLVVADLTLTPDRPEAGCPMELRVLVANQGWSPAPGVSLEIRDQRDAVLAEDYLPALEPGTCQEVTLQLVAPEPGPFQLLALLDAAGLIEESGESNNQAIIGSKVQALSGGGLPAAPQALGGPFLIEMSAFCTDVLGAHPKVAWDGANFLVVYPRQSPLSSSTYGHRLVAQRISPTGSKLDPAGIILTPQSGKYNSYNVAFDGTSYLVVWERDLGYANPAADPATRIEGVRVSTAGQVLDATPITIEARAGGGQGQQAHESVDLAFTGTDYLVVYRSSTCCQPISATLHGIFGRLVTPAGQVRQARHSLFTPTSSFQAFGLQSLTYDPARGEGLLSFNSWKTIGTQTVHAVCAISMKVQGTSVQGSLPHTLRQGAGSSIPFEYPAVAAGAGGRYLTVFEDLTGKSSNWPDLARVVLGPITPLSVPIAGSGTLVKGVCEEYPDVAWDGQAHTVVYRHHVGCLSYVGATRVTAQGAVGGSTVLKNQCDLVGTMSVAFGSTRGLVVFTNFNKPTTPGGTDFSWNVVGIFIDRTP